MRRKIAQHARQRLIGLGLGVPTSAKRRSGGASPQNECAARQRLAAVCG
jgi:hypothetical protein